MKGIFIALILTTGMCGGKAEIKTFKSEYECESYIKAAQDNGSVFENIKANCASIDYLLQESAKK